MSKETFYQQSVDPGAAPSGYMTLYMKTDKVAYVIDDAGNITPLNAVSSYGVRNPVRVASTANVASITGLLTIDGVTVSAGDRVLLKNQSTGSQNGIYVAASGAWSRATDFATTTTIKGGMILGVSEGSTQADTAWFLSANDPITVGTTSLSFTQLGGVPSAASLPIASPMVSVNSGVLNIDNGNEKALTDAATISGVDITANTAFSVTLGGARTMAAPTGTVTPSARKNSLKITFAIRQDGTGGRTLAWTTGAGGFEFATNLGVLLADFNSLLAATPINGVIFVAFQYHGGIDRWCAAGLSGYFT